MFVSYSSSDAYAEYTGISICSLLSNNNVDELFLLNNGIGKENLRKIEEIIESYECKYTIIDINEIMERYARENPIPKFKGSYSTYSRIVPDLIYPDYVDSILIIDSDTIVARNLDDFPWDNLERKVIAAINNPESVLYADKILTIEEQQSLKTKGFYLNCGIVAYNLNEWREKSYSKKIKQTISTICEFRFVDQTIINLCVSKEDTLLINLKYNSFFHGFPSAMIDTYKDVFSRINGCNDLDEAISNPSIIHYKGSIMRPWIEHSFTSMSDIYYFYKDKTPWKDTPLQHRTQLPFYLFKHYIRNNYIAFAIKKIRLKMLRNQYLRDCLSYD